MAEIQTHGTKKSKGVPHCKKLSTKVDLTPMVDLGFLLITFFVFTTSITKPTAMKLAIPGEGDGAETASGKTMSVLLGARNAVYYYYGDSANNMYTTNFSSKGLREVIRNKKLEVQQKYGDPNETVLLIKPTSDASYRNVVDALDEMLINNVKRYILMDANEVEKASLFKK